MFSRTRITRLRRWSVALAAGVALFQSCQATVDAPGVMVDASDDAVFVEFPTGNVEVSDRGVFVDVPFVSLKIPGV